MQLLTCVVSALTTIPPEEQISNASSIDCGTSRRQGAQQSGIKRSMSTPFTWLRRCYLSQPNLKYKDVRLGRLLLDMYMASVSFPLTPSSVQGPRGTQTPDPIHAHLEPDSTKSTPKTACRINPLPLRPIEAPVTPFQMWKFRKQNLRGTHEIVIAISHVQLVIRIHSK
jgi:hypothetical protein